MEFNFSEKIKKYFEEREVAPELSIEEAQGKVDFLIKAIASENNIDIDILQKVYNRGLNASKEYLFPGYTPVELAVARVKLFTNRKNQQPIPKAYTNIDLDLDSNREDRKFDPRGEAFGSFDKLTLDLSKLSLIMSGLDTEEKRLLIS